MHRYQEDEIIEKVGGKFKLASLLEKRYREMLFGSKPMVKIDTGDPLDVLVEEVMEDKVQLIPEADAIAAAASALLYEPAGDAEREAEKVAEELARASSSTSPAARVEEEEDGDEEL